MALVVGANDYQSVTKLTNAVADAEAIAQRLGNLGFRIVGAADGRGPLLNPTKEQFVAALDRFEGALRGASLGLIFYAGHAVEVGWRNLLLPIDTPGAHNATLYRTTGRLERAFLVYLDEVAARLALPQPPEPSS